MSERKARTALLDLAEACLSEDIGFDFEEQLVAVLEKYKLRISVEDDPIDDEEEEK